MSLTFQVLSAKNFHQREKSKNLIKANVIMLLMEKFVNAQLTKIQMCRVWQMVQHIMCESVWSWFFLLGTKHPFVTAAFIHNKELSIHSHLWPHHKDLHVRLFFSPSDECVWMWKYSPCTLIIFPVDAGGVMEGTGGVWWRWTRWRQKGIKGKREIREEKN